MSENNGKSISATIGSIWQKLLNILGLKLTWNDLTEAERSVLVTAYILEVPEAISYMDKYFEQVVASGWDKAFELPNGSNPYVAKNTKKKHQKWMIYAIIAGVLLYIAARD